MTTLDHQDARLWAELGKEFSAFASRAARWLSAICMDRVAALAASLTLAAVFVGSSAGPGVV